MGYHKPIANAKHKIEEARKMLETGKNGIGDQLAESTIESLKSSIKANEALIAKYILVNMPYRVYKSTFEQFGWETGEYNKETKKIEVYMPKEELDESLTSAEQIEAELEKM